MIRVFPNILIYFLGNSCWELFCLEHGIGQDGLISTEKSADNVSGEISESRSSDTFFLATGVGNRQVPRAIFIDLGIKKGSYLLKYNLNEVDLFFKSQL